MCLQPKVGAKGVGVHQVIKMIGWQHSLGPLRREMYQLVRVSEDTLFKFKVRSVLVGAAAVELDADKLIVWQLFLEWLVRFLLLGKPDLIRMLFKAFDTSKRGDMTRAGTL